MSQPTNLPWRLLVGLSTGNGQSALPGDVVGYAVLDSSDKVRASFGPLVTSREDIEAMIEAVNAHYGGPRWRDDEIVPGSDADDLAWKNRLTRVARLCLGCAEVINHYFLGEERAVCDKHDLWGSNLKGTIAGAERLLGIRR